MTEGDASSDGSSRLDDEAAVEDAAWPTAPRQLSSGAEGGETRWWGARVRENRGGGEPCSRGSHLEVEGPACATGKAAPEGLGGVRSTLRASIYVPYFSRVSIFISLLLLEELRIYVVPPPRRPSVVSLPARLTRRRAHPARLILRFSRCRASLP